MTHFTRLIDLTSADDAFVSSLVQNLAPCILRPRTENSLTMNERHSYRLLHDLLRHKDEIFGELKRQSSTLGLAIGANRPRAISTDESNRRAAVEARNRAIVDRSRASSPAPGRKHRRDRSSGASELGRFPISVGSPMAAERRAVSSRHSLEVPDEIDPAGGAAASSAAADETSGTTGSSSITTRSSARSSVPAATRRNGTVSPESASPPPPASSEGGSSTQSSSPSRTAAAAAAEVAGSPSSTPTTSISGWPTRQDPDDSISSNPSTSSYNNGNTSMHHRSTGSTDRLEKRASQTRFGSGSGGGPARVVRKSGLGSRSGFPVIPSSGLASAFNSNRNSLAAADGGDSHGHGQEGERDGEGEGEGESAKRVVVTLQDKPMED